MGLFYDTYAILSLIDGNEDYGKYRSDIITTGILNFAELYNVFLRSKGKKTADYWARKLNLNIVEMDKDSIIKAVRLRFDNKKENLSPADCIGYFLALKNKMKFLTGDEKFKNKENVEFVK
jgi:PIN domain nuclease of toxin-antitoxin system